MSPNGLLGRILLTVTAIWLLGGLALRDQLRGAHRAEVERGERVRLQEAASLIAASVDTASQRAALEQYPIEDNFTTWQSASPEAIALHRSLADAARRLELASPILTARLPERSKVAVASDPRSVHRDALEIIATSEETPRWRHPLAFRPEMLPTLLRGEVSSTGIYEGARGETIAAYAPLLDGDGSPAGMLIIESDPTELASALREPFTAELGTAAAAGALALLAITALLRRPRRELSTLREATARLGRGDLHTPIPIPVSAELTPLGRGLELARRRLAKQVAALTDRCRALERSLSDARAQLEPQVLARRERITSGDTPIAASVEVSAASQRPCRLIDLGYEDAIIRVPAGSPVDLAAGMPAALSVQIGDDAVRFDVRTTLRLELDGELEYHLELLSPLRDYEDTPAGLMDLLNARGAFRVFPSNHAPVLADVLSRSGGSLVADAAVENLSESGLAIRVPQPPAVVATWGTHLTLHISLPGHLVPIELAARVRNVAESMGGTRLGLAFDVDDRDFQQKREHITDYVRERLRELHISDRSVAA